MPRINLAEGLFAEGPGVPEVVDRNSVHTLAGFLGRHGLLLRIASRRRPATKQPDERASRQCEDVLARVVDLFLAFRGWGCKGSEGRCRG